MEIGLLDLGDQPREVRRRDRLALAMRGRVLVASVRDHADLELATAEQHHALRVQLAVARIAVEQAGREREAVRAGDARILEQEAARDADALGARGLDLVAQALARRPSPPACLRSAR